MIQFIRKFFQSKLGIGVTLAFLGVIAIAFASGDVLNSGSFGDIDRGSRIALIGDEAVTAEELTGTANSALEQARASNPTLTMEGFVSNGGLEDVLESLKLRIAASEFGKLIGLKVSSRLVDSEIAQIPGFRGIDGKFDRAAFQATLRQRGLTEADVRSDIARGMYLQQLFAPTAYGTVMSQSMAHRYASMFGETRSGMVAALPAAAFLPAGEPSQAVLQKFYQDKRGRFIRPERRVVRYATFGEEALKNVPPPSQAQIAERYKQRADDFTAKELRDLTQLIAPTKAAAQAIVNEVKAGSTLEAAAKAKGLSTIANKQRTRQQVAANHSMAVANAAFTAAQGGISTPAQAPLGWVVMRVDSVTKRPARSLEQVRGELTEQLALENKRRAFGALVESVEDNVLDGSNIVEIAKDLGIGLKTTRPLTAAGKIYGTAEDGPPELSRVISTAFSVDEGEPQLEVLAADQTYILFDVTDITESAVAPLAEIKKQVVALWRREEAMRLAGEATERVIKASKSGKSLAAAIAAEEARLPEPEAVRLSRAAVVARGPMPPVMTLFFSMAQGTTKPLKDERGGAWFVVELNEIDLPEMAKDHRLVQQARTQLGQQLGEEYFEQFLAAMQDEVGTEMNDDALKALKAQLSGRTGQ